MAEKKIERQELTPDLRKKKEVIQEVQDQLGELRKELGVRKRNAGKKDAAPEQSLEESGVVETLKRAWSDAYLAHENVDSAKMKGFEKWKDFEKAMGGEAATSGITDLLIALADPKEEEQKAKDAALRLEIKQLGDEMNAGQKYLETFPAAPLSERVVEQVDKLLSKLPPGVQDFLLPIIMDFLANFGESFGMLDFSGSLRFRSAMEQAKGDEVELNKLTPEEETEVLKASADPVVRSSLEGKWKVLHKKWAQRKKNFEASAQGQKFAEFPPTIFDVYKKEEAPKPTALAAAPAGPEKLPEKTGTPDPVSPADPKK
jgi:hypothetical protein